MMLTEFTKTTGITEITEGYERISTFRVEDLKNILNELKPGTTEVKLANLPYRKYGKKAGAALLFQVPGTSTGHWLYVSPVQVRNPRIVSIQEILPPEAEQFPRIPLEELSESIQAFDSLHTTRQIIDRNEIFDEVISHPEKYPHLAAKNEKRIKQSITTAMNRQFTRMNGLQSKNPAWKVSL